MTLPFDLSLTQMVGLIVVGGLAVLCIVAVFASGTSEELDAVLAVPCEDYVAESQLTMADLEAEWAKSAPMREAALHADPYNVEEDW